MVRRTQKRKVHTVKMEAGCFLSQPSQQATHLSCEANAPLPPNMNHLVTWTIRQLLLEKYNIRKTAFIFAVGEVEVKVL